MAKKGTCLSLVTMAFKATWAPGVYKPAILQAMARPPYQPHLFRLSFTKTSGAAGDTLVVCAEGTPVQPRWLASLLSTPGQTILSDTQEGMLGLLKIRFMSKHAPFNCTHLNRDKWKMEYMVDGSVLARIDGWNARLVQDKRSESESIAFFENAAASGLALLASRVMMVEKEMASVVDEVEVDSMDPGTTILGERSMQQAGDMPPSVGDDYDKYSSDDGDIVFCTDSP